MIQKVRDWKNKKQYAIEKYHSDGEVGAFRFSDKTWWLVDDDIVFGEFSGKLYRFGHDNIHIGMKYTYMGVVYHDLVEINDIEYNTTKYDKKS